MNNNQLIDQSEFNKHRNNIKSYESLFKSTFELNIKDYYGKDVITMSSGFDIVKFEADLRILNENLSEYNIGEIVQKIYKPNGIWLLLKLL